MPGTEISTVVENILEAFKNGLDLFKQLRGRKKSRLSKDALSDPEELRVHDSLLLRPQEIRDQYARNVTKFGHRFEMGDSIAHNSLGHVLLVLNTGLMNLINHALRGDSGARAASRQSLYDLSEMAAVDTLSALSQLYLRLNKPRPVLMPAHGHHRTAKDEPQADTKHRSTGPKQDRRPPSPLSERGGWVRSRSGSSSTVSVITPKKKTRARPEKNQRSFSEQVIRKTDFPVGIPLTTQTTNESMTCSCHNHSCPLPDIPQVNGNYLQRPRKQPSMLIMPVDIFDSIHEDLLTIRPARPPKIPLHSRPRPNSHAPYESEPLFSPSLTISPAPHTLSSPPSSTTSAAISTTPEYISPFPASRKPRPASLATFMTTSTKIGEIPEHKWSDRIVSADEVGARPLPYVIPPPLMVENEDRSRKRRGLKFWKKDKREEVGVS